MTKLERNYQPHVIERLESTFPGCIVLKNDPNYLQGIPDLSVFWKGHWAWLETKRAANASHRPNQDYYVDLGNEWSFARFVQPSNEEEVFHDLQQAFAL